MFIPGPTPDPTRDNPQARWFLFSDDGLWLLDGPQGLQIPRQQQLTVLPDTAIQIGQFDGHPCLVAEQAPPPGQPWQASGLRALIGRIDDALWQAAGAASQWLRWVREHRYCGACGQPTELDPAALLCRCPNCELPFYPRLSPAVIVAVRRREQILLAHNRRFPPGYHSVLAGFVEPGETLEDAARREIFEEVGIRVRNLRYFASQNWPFPGSLMVGFLADYAGGEIAVDGDEIDSAGWFAADHLPQLPPPVSIARRLIDRTLGLSA